MTLEPILKRVLKYSFGNIRRRTTDIIGQGGELPQSTRSDKIEINTELVSRALKYRITDIKTFEFIRHAGEKRGFYVILLSRLLPFISFDVVSYMAGLSGIHPWAFIFGTGLGMLPATIIYTFIGHEIPAMEENFPMLLTYTVVFIFILVVFSLVQGVRKKV